MSYDAMGKPEASIPYIYKAIKIAPAIPDYWFIQGDVQIKLSKTSEGIASYLKVIELNPEDPDIWLELSFVYADLADFDKALETITSGLKWHDENPDYFYTMANYLFKTGKIKESYETLEKALSMDYSGHVRMLSAFPDLKTNTGFTEIIEEYKQSN